MSNGVNSDSDNSSRNGGERGKQSSNDDAMKQKQSRGNTRSEQMGLSPSARYDQRGGNESNAYADETADGDDNGMDDSGQKTFGTKARPLASGPNVCRDYLNNVCFRGASCKYEHPPLDSAVNRSSSGGGGFADSGRGGGSDEPEFDFCSDFPYMGCARGSACRFVHCSRAEIESFQSTGRWSEAVARAVLACVAPTERQALPRTLGGRPLCKQYMNTECARGARCRFWHIDPRDARLERQSLSAGGNVRRNSNEPSYAEHVPPGRMARGGDAQQARAFTADYSLGGVRYPEMYGSQQQHGGDGRHDYKRPRYANDYDGPSVPQLSVVDTRLGIIGGCAATLSQSCVKLSDENAVLRRKIEILKQTLQDMQSANDALLSENTRLRSKTVGAAADQARAVSMASAAAMSNVFPAVGGGSVAPSAAVVTQSSAVISGLTPEQHMAVVSLAAAAQQQQQQAAAAVAGAGGGTVIVHPSSLTYTASRDGLQWSWAQMRR